jgi:hypothetical protein
MSRSPIVCVRRKLRVWDNTLEAAATRPKLEWGYKEIGNRALHDHHPDVLIGLEFPSESIDSCDRTSSRRFIDG